MRTIVDLHIHSKYSRACSKELTLPNIAQWCGWKGIHVVGTGDFTHPRWFAELKEQLVRDEESGLYALHGSSLEYIQTSPPPSPIRRGGVRRAENGQCAEPLFVPTAEVSCIYTRGGRGRRVHHIIVAPTLDVVAKINKKLAAIGNITHDGRPILGLDSEELAKIVFNASPECMLIPAHAFTPWFAVFGSKSGFDTLEECFGSMTPHIRSIETGLSADPPMYRQLSALDDITLISNSDAHSLPNLGREATVFDFKTPSYGALKGAIEDKNDPALLYTIEFFPEEGKYHADGHRECSVRMMPQETNKHGGICPTCKKKVTVGVLNRVDALADRAYGTTPQTARSYKSIIPLQEIIADAYGVGKQSKRVQRTYLQLVQECADEFSILLDAPYATIAQHASPLVVEGIKRVREGKVNARAGYDGVFGTIALFTNAERKCGEQWALLLQ